MKLILTNLLLLSLTAASAQARLTIEDAVINISNGAVLTIENPDNNALTRTGTGYIISEGPVNRIAWFIGAGNNTNYVIPFGNGTVYFPVSFKADGGTNDGLFVFSTYPTSTWKNSDELPPGVTNVNSNGVDNSEKLVDRFWQIAPLNYTTKPSLTDLTFTYTDLEIAQPNTINENSLIAQRWNNILNSWSDYIPTSLVNTAAKTLTTSLSGDQLYDWWALTDGAAILPIKLSAFKAVPVGRTVGVTWQTSSETNSSHFEIWRSSTGQAFEKIGTAIAKSPSSILSNYSFTDHTPYAGNSYYKLRAVDVDGKYTWSATAKVNMATDILFRLFPNPAKNLINLTGPIIQTTIQTTVTLLNSRGQKINSFLLQHSNQSIDISKLAPGVYYLQVISDGKTRTLPFIKP